MAEISVSEARNNLSRLIRRAQEGQETVITSRGRPVARIVPLLPVPTGTAPTGTAPTGTALADWLRAHQAPPEVARTRAEVDFELTAERYREP